MGFAILFAAAGARLESQCTHKDIRIPGTEKVIKQALQCHAYSKTGDTPLQKERPHITHIMQIVEVIEASLKFD